MADIEFRFLHDFVRKQLSPEDQAREKNKYEKDIQYIVTTYETWVDNNHSETVDKKKDMYSKMNSDKKKIYLHYATYMINAFDRSVENQRNEFYTCKFHDKLLSSEIKVFLKYCSSTIFQEYNIFKTFDAPCGCVLWKGRLRKNRFCSSIPDYYRKFKINSKTKTCRGHPAVILYNIFRERCDDMGGGWSLKKTCLSPNCINPYHHEFVKLSRTKRKREE